MNALYLFCGFIGAAVLLAFLFFILPAWFEKPTPSGTEPGYYIRRIKDGYPMHVGSEAYDKALYTGDYYLEGESGGRVPIGQQYKDERLN